MAITLDEFEKGEEKFARVEGVSFRGSVLEAVPTDKALNADEVHAVVSKIEAFGEKKMAQTRTALNNLLRDKKLSRRYVENKAYYTKAEPEIEEDAPAEE